MEFANAKWIWISGQGIENDWVEFRRSFEILQAWPDATLLVSVDTDYCVWINGVFVYTGQFSDHPKSKHYDQLAIGRFLRLGLNSIAILAFHQGKSSLRYRKGKPGLIFEIQNCQEQISSSKGTRVRRSQSYKKGPVPSVTIQLGLTINYDASREDNWKDSDYDDKNWEFACEVAGPVDGFWTELVKRPLEKLIIGERCPAAFIKMGRINRLRDLETAAMTVANDVLTTDSEELFTLNTKSSLEIKPAEFGFNGVFVLIDLFEESFGYLELEIDAPSGVVIDIAHGEHIVDGRVRCRIGTRNFVDRYSTIQGHQKWFMPMRRLGCRFIELHLTNLSSTCKLFYAGLKPVSYPLEHPGSFECDLQLHNTIYRVSNHTLELCMHEHYEDCPWREQALYSMDSKNQALCGYFSFGEYKFPRESFRLLGRSVRADNFLEITAPGELDITIPCFSMAWIVEIRDHILYSGDFSLAEEFWNQMENMLLSYWSRIDEHGILPVPKDKAYWNFYEWSAGLDGSDQSKSSYTDCCLNLFLIEAIKAFSEICEFQGSPTANLWKDRAIKLSAAVCELFFDKGTGLFVNQISDDGTRSGYSQLTQALALCLQILDEQTAAGLRSKIAGDPKLVPATLSMLGYVYDALLEQPQIFDEFVMEDIKAKWGYMLENGATSFWETIKGQADFDGAGSLCHGWSAIPIIFYNKYVLGIRPVQPGFKQFQINPCTSGLDHAQGMIPTPHGNIKIRWSNKPSMQIELQHPDSIKALVPESIKNDIKINKRGF